MPSPSDNWTSFQAFVACGVVINGVPHGPQPGTTTCQLPMRDFKDGQVVVIEPFHTHAFPVLRDLMVDRSALDPVVQAGGTITAPTGNAPDGKAILVGRADRCPFFASHLFSAGAEVDTLGEVHLNGGYAELAQPFPWRVENSKVAYEFSMAHRVTTE